jgi:hypothetical protein
MALPDLTHLQFLIIGALVDGEQPGRVVRDRLADAGVVKSGPGFYQLMARLEEAKLVEGRYEQKVIDGQALKERRYKMTGLGEQSWTQARNFYLTFGRSGLQGGLAHG